MSKPNSEETGGRPLVSVIVPTYNHEKLIGHALRSIAEQDYRPIEALVCDDESTDNTRAAVERAGHDFVRYVRVPHSGMPPATMNAGLKEAKGDIIMFLDGDDQWLPGKVKKQVDHFLSHPECDFLFGDSYYVVTGDGFMAPDPSRDTLYFSWKRPPATVTPAALFPHTCIPTVTIAFRRKILDAGVQLNARMRYVWDTAFCVEVLTKGYRAEWLDEPLAAYRKHTRNISGAWFAITESIGEYLRIIEMARGHLSPSFIRKQVERWKYEYFKQSIKFEAFKSIGEIRQSPYFPATHAYRMKVFYYLWFVRLKKRFDPRA